MTLNQYLSEVSARVERATPGPWRVSVDAFAPEGWPLGSFGCHTDESGTDHDYRLHTAPIPASYVTGDGARGDTTFCAHARTDVPRLVAMLRVAIPELRVAASYVDDPSNTAGLNTHARACAKALATIDDMAGGE